MAPLAAITAETAITAGTGIVKSIIGGIQSAKQRKEAKRQEEKAKAQKKIRDAKLNQVETSAEQRAGATKAPGIAEAEQSLERNTAQNIASVNRNTNTGVNALNAASMANQQKNQASLNLAAKNKQYLDEAQKNLQGVRQGRAQVTEADRRESVGRADAYAASSDTNLENAINTPLTTAMVLGQMGKKNTGTGTTTGLYGDFLLG